MTEPVFGLALFALSEDFYSALFVVAFVVAFLVAAILGDD